MRQSILHELKEIEEKENVKIIYAAESGSRAWGFASVDSDYDVRFIYVRKPSYYLELEKTKDVIEWKLDDTLDINGWDLKKALKLLYTSNPTLFEWSNSPIVYKTTDFYEELRTKIYKYFSCKSGLYHYLNTAKSNYREYLKTDFVKAKKYFYVLRPILACRWIMENKNPPPMLFSELVKAQLEEEMVPVVDKLLHLKINSKEVKEIARIDILNEFIEKNILSIQEEVLKIYDPKDNKYDELNNIFLRALDEFFCVKIF